MKSVLRPIVRASYLDALYRVLHIAECYKGPVAEHIISEIKRLISDYMKEMAEK